MKRMVFIFFALSCPPVTASDIAPSIELLDCAKGSACVPMLLDVPDDSRQSVVLSPNDQNIEGAQDSDGNTKFHVRFEGRMKGKTETIDAIFKGYTDGIHCTAFGQGTVGLLGYSHSGNPIINSSVGPIEVTDTKVQVGCDHCLVVKDAKTSKTIATFRSPGYDLLLTGTARRIFPSTYPVAIT